MNSWLGWGRGGVESPMMFLWSLDGISQVCLLKTTYTQITWDFKYSKTQTTPRVIKSSVVLMLLK